MHVWHADNVNQLPLLLLLPLPLQVAGVNFEEMVEAAIDDSNNTHMPYVYTDLFRQIILLLLLLPLAGRWR
jgi:hypothetical protein